MTTQQYIDAISKKYEIGNTTEHSFQDILEQLIQDLLPHIQVTNEPKRQACGAPDYILTKNDIPVGFIEASIIKALTETERLMKVIDAIVLF